MKRVSLVVVLAAAVLAGAAPVRAQEDRTVSVDPHREGVYGGVNPKAPTEAHKVKHRGATAKKTLHWIGFQQKTAAAEVFLQAAEPFTVEQRIEGGAVVVSVTGLTKLGLNTRRPVVTRFFDGPIVRITAHARRARRPLRGKPRVTAGIDVTVAFRDGQAATGEVRTATEADGMFYAYLTFPGGASPDSSTSTPVRSAPGTIIVTPAEPAPGTIIITPAEPAPPAPE